MRDCMELLDRWIENVDDEELLAELQAMKDEGDQDAIRDAFSKDLAFGTAGLRGILGAGSNRMNRYTVARATQGLADYLNAHFEKPRVAIARDSRNMGMVFTSIAAGVLAANGIYAYVFPRVEATPTLSFAVRDLHCQAGICVTASHNPAPYNGYKVYGPDGCQITEWAANAIQDAIAQVDIFEGVKSMPFRDADEQGKAGWIGDDTIDRYIDAVAAQSLEPLSENLFAEDDDELEVVYTPLNGVGMECVGRILRKVGGIDITPVREQSKPDGDFPTCPYPNPETREALERGLQLCELVKPDLLLATDPDADRVGIAVRHEGEYRLISGNEMGILLLDYICKLRQERDEDLSRAVAVTTVVSSTLIDQMAREYGFQLRRTLTGFKYIGEQIRLLELDGEADRFIFGFEESYGYLSGAHVRDKDAVNASMLICQMARHYKRLGLDLVQVMEGLYQRFGYCRNKTVSLEFPGASGADRMAQIMADLREQPPAQLGGLTVQATADYAAGAPMPIVNALEGEPAQTLPEANVFEMSLGGASKVIVRPSGTEPKVKAYLFASTDSDEASCELIAALERDVRELLA